MSLSARTHSASSRSSTNNLTHGGGGSRRYRRVAHTPQVDDTLFGEKNQLLKSRKNDRTRQAGRDIVGAHSSNQEGSGHDSKSTFGSQLSKRAGGKRVVTKTALVVVPEDELERIKAETKILTPADLEALEAKREADQEHQRLTSKARKEHMLKLSEEAAQRAPKSEIEQIFSAEKHEILRRAQGLKDQMHDSVKLMKTLGTRAQAFTIRDQQLKVKRELEEEHQVYDDKMNTLMEIERLESLKRQEERDAIKKQKRYADRKVLEDQIEGRRRQRQKETDMVAQEAQDMLTKIKRQQEEAAEKERVKALRAQRSMEEIKKFNDETLHRKQEVQRKIKEEEDQVLAYQLKKAEDLKRREEEEAQRRYEAELRCAKLRSMQEKMANEKAELDELRAKRAAEARERQAREADLALARKHKEEMDELRHARETQALHRERARVKEATLQQREYESIMVQVESDTAHVKTEDEKRKLASMAHRRVLQSQIEDKERLKKLAFVKKQEEGQALKEEFASELKKLERIRLEEVGELVDAGVNPLYLSEMKALVIEKQIRIPLCRILDYCLPKSEEMAAQEVLAHAAATARGDSLSTHQCDLLAPENEYLDPNPDLHSLFLEYNRMFFEGRLAGCEVKWSKRMTLCAGLCSFQPRSGFCSIRLSEPLLKLRPRSDMVNTLLHEMIHAYVFVATPVRDHDDHGPLFQSHMHRINKAAKTQITVFHSFHDEVDAYRQHIWQCDGPCRRKAPYFGLVKRSMNRVPGPNDTWWADHERSCGGSYSKIKEPAAFTAKQAKKKERELARAEKQKKKDDEAKVAPSVKQFFPTVQEKVGGKANKALRDDTTPPRASKKTLPQAKPEVDNNKKRKKESGGDNNSSSWPMLGFPAVAPVIFSADGDEDEYFLVGDIQALFQTTPTQPFHGSIGTRDQTTIPGLTAQTKSEAVPVVDLTVSDGDTSDTEDGQVEFKHSPSAAAISQTTSTQTAEPDVIEID